MKARRGIENDDEGTRLNDSKEGNEHDDSKEDDQPKREKTMSKEECAQDIEDRWYCQYDERQRQIQRLDEQLKKM